MSIIFVNKHFIFAPILIDVQLQEKLSNQGNPESDIFSLRNNRHFSRTIATSTSYGFLLSPTSSISFSKRLNSVISPY